MKTLLSILMVALLGTMVSANPGSKSDYFVTNDGKVVVATVHLGLLNINARSIEGDILKVNYKDVVSFQHDGELYTKKPLYNDKTNEGMVFMKLISWRNGLSLYCFEDISLGLKNNKRYFVFKDENTFWLEVDQNNSQAIENFFKKI